MSLKTNYAKKEEAVIIEWKAAAPREREREREREHRESLSRPI